jgi:F-type H+-transporting ATPase subunit delta
MLVQLTLARPYAKAILAIALATKSYEKWDELLKFLCIIVADVSVITLLKDRTIPVQKVADFFLALCQACGQCLDESQRNFITVLACNRRLEVLPQITYLYQQMYLEKEQMVDVEFTSSIALSEDQKAGFKKVLEQYFSKTVNMHCKIDKELLGGFLARAGNYVIDGSVRSYLTSLEKSIGA